MAEEKFEEHMMYKGEKAEKANTFQEHLKLKKMGFGHKRPVFKMASPLYKKGFKDNYQGPCWDNHKMVGTKMKNDKKVPNCVPK